MKILPRIILITGESGAGKTAFCRQAIDLARQHGWRVTGVLTLPRFVNGARVGMEVHDVSTGEQRALGELAPTEGPYTEKWHFNPSALAWGSEILGRAVPCDLLVVDELGPLELGRGEGWSVAFDLLRMDTFRVALVVVRPSLLSCFREKIPGIEFSVVNVNNCRSETFNICEYFSPCGDEA